MFSRLQTPSLPLLREPAGRLRLASIAAALLALVLAVATRAAAPSASASQALAGQPAPAFSLAPLAGDRTGTPPVTLASERGHPLLLVFTYTLCPHCLPQTQTAVSLASDERASGLRVLLVDSPAESPAIVAAYLARVPGASAGGVTTLLDTGGAVARAYHVGLYPTTVLIDGQGVVRHVWTGETDESALRTALRRIAQG